MKSLLLSLVFVLTVSVSGFGQLKGGLKGGLNLTDIIITNGANYFENSSFDTRASYHFGSYVQSSFSKNFGFQIEMIFSNKGYTLNTDSASVNVSLNYLNWPILLAYNLGDKFSFNAGMEFGLLVTGEDIYKNFDLGIDVGVEYDISEKVIAGLRYNHGFPFKMNIDSFDFTGTEPQYQHSVIQFYIGFNIVNEPGNKSQ